MKRPTWLGGRPALTAEARARMAREVAEEAARVRQEQAAREEAARQYREAAEALARQVQRGEGPGWPDSGASSSVSPSRLRGRSGDTGGAAWFARLRGR